MTPARLRILGVLGAVVLIVGGIVLLTRDDGGDDTSEVETADDSTSTTSEPSTTEDASTTTAETTTTTGTPSTTKAPGTTAPGAQPDPFSSARIKLTRVASFDYPVAMAARPADDSLWIARKGGAVCRLTGDSCTNSQVVARVSTGNEQGLLGITFNPSGSRFYISYTNPEGDSRVDEFPVRDDGTADLEQRRNIFSADQPEANHNGGHIVFGPDGRLYLGLGDGGGGGDRHGTIGNGQDPSTDLGKILRIDPAGPTVQRWISGVRNPWRFTFDRTSGSLWIGDVGQGSWEEIDYLPPGAQQGRNLGWRCFEGTHAYEGCAPAGGHIPPVYEYPHDPGCSVTGGYVYRGTKIPALVGAYLFSDYCDGEIRGLTLDGDGVRTARDLGVNPGSVVSFGQANNGDLYVLSPSAVYRIDPA